MRAEGTRVPAGWYPDPLGAPVLRWWDNRGWTEHTAPADAPVPTRSPLEADAEVESAGLEAAEGSPEDPVAEGTADRSTTASADDELESRFGDLLPGGDREPPQTLGLLLDEVLGAANLAELPARTAAEPADSADRAAATLPEPQPTAPAAAPEPATPREPQLRRPGVLPFALDRTLREGPAGETAPDRAESAPIATASAESASVVERLLGVERAATPAAAASPVTHAHLASGRANTVAAWLLALSPLWALLIGIAAATTVPARAGSWEAAMVGGGVLAALTLGLAIIDTVQLRRRASAPAGIIAGVLLGAPGYLFVRAVASGRAGAKRFAPFVVVLLSGVASALVLMLAPGLAIATAPTVAAGYAEHAVAEQAGAAGMAGAVRCTRTLPLTVGGTTLCTVGSGTAQQTVRVTLVRSGAWIAWRLDASS